MQDASAAMIAPARSRHFSAIRSPDNLHIRSVRPSVLDLRFCGDPWIVAGRDGRFALYLGDYSLVRIDGSNLDLPGLNTLLDRLRHRRPRRRACFSR
jgi:hypothetical protein